MRFWYLPNVRDCICAWFLSIFFTNYAILPNCTLSLLLFITVIHFFKANDPFLSSVLKQNHGYMGTWTFLENRINRQSKKHVFIIKWRDTLCSLSDKSWLWWDTRKKCVYGFSSLSDKIMIMHLQKLVQKIESGETWK